MKYSTRIQTEKLLFAKFKKLYQPLLEERVEIWLHKTKTVSFRKVETGRTFCGIFNFLETIKVQPLKSLLNHSFAPNFAASPWSCVLSAQLLLQVYSYPSSKTGLSVYVDILPSITSKIHAKNETYNADDRRTLTLYCCCSTDEGGGGPQST